MRHTSIRPKIVFLRTAVNAFTAVRKKTILGPLASSAIGIRAYFLRE